LEGSPFGPWQAVDDTAGEGPRFDDPFAEDQPQPPVLDGVAGMFSQVYWWLGRPSRLHPQMSQAEVDACEVHVVAQYLGVAPEDPDDPFGPLTGDYAADAARVNARRLREAEAAAKRQQAETEAPGGEGGVAHSGA
jgi:hypothetical protein